MRFEKREAGAWRCSGVRDAADGIRSSLDIAHGTGMLYVSSSTFCSNACSFLFINVRINTFAIMGGGGGRGGGFTLEGVS